MSSSLDAIKRVVAAFERSDWTEIDVRIGDVRVHLAAGTPGHAAPVPPASRRQAVAHTAPAAAVHEGASGSADATPPPAGAHVVVSPSPGIFWRSPEPGAPPFADVGQAVDPTATVCIVEIMKLMNHLKAGVSGTVVAVYGENGVAVEKGERLFAIVPDAAGPTG